MADYVASQTISLDDQLSAGAAAAAATLDKLADSADAAASSTDNVAASVTKAGPSATALARACDPATKALQDLAVAQANLSSRAATMAAAVAAGTATQAQANAVNDVYTAKLRAAQAAVDQLTVSNVSGAKAAAGLTEANGEAAVAATAASGAHAGLYREIVILGHEVVTGNFARIPGSLMVLAERSGQLDTIFQGVVKTFTTLPGIAAVVSVAGVGAFVAMAVSADNFAQKNIELQNQISATKDDYTALASEAQDAARAASNATPGLSRTDATAAAGTIVAAPQFTGTTAQLTNLVELAANMGAVFKETAEKAATDLAAAMDQPGQAADRLVGHLRGMTQAVADSIVQMAAAGDKAGAFATYEGVLADAVDGATMKLSPMRQAIRDIEAAFNEGGTASGRFSESLGSAFDKLVSKALEGIAGVLNALKEFRDWDAQYLPWAQGYGQAPGTSGAAGTGSVADTINSVGGSLGASSAVVSLAQRIAPVESSTGQFNAAGGVVTSSAGALGAMQVLPMNAAGNDLNTLTGNVTAAETLLIRLYQKYNGNEYLVAAAYNWGEGNVDSMLANGTQAPQSVQDYASKVAAGGTSTGAAASIGVSNSATGVVNQALAVSSNSMESQAVALAAKIANLKQGLINLTAQGVDPSSSEFYKLTTELSATTLAYSNLATPLDKLLQQTDVQIDSQESLTEAYGKGYAAVAEATAANTAYGEAVTTVGTKSEAFGATITLLTQKHLALAQATAATGVAQETLANGDTLQYLQAETDSLGTNGVARDAMLAQLKAEQELRAKNVDVLSTEGQAYLASVDAISAQTAALAKNQQTLSDLESLATSSFDSVSSAITNAFAQGGKSAIDFGNIARTVLSAVVADVAKIGVLNPILNSLFGGSRTTLSDVESLLSGGSSAAPNGTVQLPSTSIGGLAQYTGTTTVPAAQTGLGGILSTSTIGTGTIGSTLGGIGAGFGIGTSLNGLLGGNAVGGDVGSAAGSAVGAAIGSIIPGIGTLLGGIIGGAGGGLLGGLFGNSKPSNFGETSHTSFSNGVTAPLASSVSSGAEYSAQNQAAASNITSTIYGGEQSIASAFNLKPLGGTGGVNASVGSRDGIWANFNNGTHYTGADTAAGAASVVNQTVGGIIATFGTQLSGTTAAILKEIDYSNSNASAQVTALAGALTNGKLDATQQKALPNINTADASSAITELDWIKNTYEATINSATDLGSVSTQTTAVNASFADLIAHAQRLGLSITGLVAAQASQVSAINAAAQATVTASGASILSANMKENGNANGAAFVDFDQAAKVAQAQLVTEFQSLYGDSYKSQADYVRQTALLTQTIAEQRQDLVASQAATQDTTTAAWVSNVTAGWKAQATIDGLQGTPTGTANAAILNENADLANFDAQAKTATDAYSQSLTNAYGEGFKSNAYYAAQMLNLEQSLATQRLAIQATYTAQALAVQKAAETSAESSATSVVTSLTSYVQSLQTGSASPLSAQAQYALAKSQYQAVAGAAAAGDVTSLGEVQSYAGTFLSASQNLNGSGAGYANDFSTVLASLQAIASIPQNTLTASFMAAALQDQTDTLAAGMAVNTAAIKAVQMELQQQNGRAA